MKAHEIETRENQHKVECRVYELKRRHIEYNHQNELTEIQETTTKAIEKQEMQRTIRSKSMRIQESMLRDDIHERGLVFCEDVKQMRIRHCEELDKIKLEETEKQLAKQAKLNEILGKTRTQLDKSLEDTLKDYDERKNQHLSNLQNNHTSSTNSMKVYYKGVIEEYSNSIDDLSDEVASKEKKISALEEEVNKMKENNSNLVEPLEEAKGLVLELKHVKLKFAEKDVASLQSIQCRLATTKKEYKELLELHRLNLEEEVE